MNVTRRIPDYLLVTLIAVLIWIYAEGRNVQTYTPADAVPIEVDLADEDMVITEQSPERVGVRFRGTAGELAKIKRVLADGFRLELGVSEPGEKSLPMVDELRGAERLAGLNVSIVAAEPSTLQLTVDRLVTESVPVVFQPADVELGEPAVPLPSQVRLTVPERLLDEVGEELSDMVLTAAPLAPIAPLRQGVEHTVRARVVLPMVLENNPHVRVEPEEVDLTFTIDKKEDSVTLPSVPVWNLAPTHDRNRFEIDLEDDRLRDVEVTGPSEMIQRVRDRAIPVVAILRLSSDDLTSGLDKENTGTVTFDLPPELNVDSPTTSVRYTVRRLEE